MSWFKSKSSNEQNEIQCSFCGTVQQVPETVSAIFCKGCKKTIYTKKGETGKETPSSLDVQQKKKAEASPSAAQVPSKQEKNKPAAPADRSAPPPPVSTATPFPPDSKSILPSSPVSTGLFSSSSAAPEPAPKPEVMKKVKCSYCSTFQDVPAIALASFCEKCGQRINLQDYRIKGNFHGELETRGKICIASGGKVQANLNVGTAVIEGRIEGEIVAENVVELLAGSMVVGTIKSNSLVVREGAGFVGKAVINPKEHMEL